MRPIGNIAEAFDKPIPKLPIEVPPDPIKENFGDRSFPYPGFLVLPLEAVPLGFKETRHHYTKSEYTITFTKMVESKHIDLDIVESPITMFVHKASDLVKEFSYQGITGQIYFSKDTYNLIWLNLPKQRIAIYLKQTPTNDYSPENVITILKSMKMADSAVKY